MRIYLISLLGCFLFIPCISVAVTNPVFYHHEKSFTHPLELKVPQTYFVKTIVSYPNEKQLAFLKRAGKDIEELTIQYDFEFCSRIWHNSKTQQFKLNISTIKSHVGCVIPREISHGGDWIPSSLTIHSHPTQSEAVANSVDVLLNQSRYKVGDIIHIENKHFSKTDHLAGAGYLVVNGHLLYQDKTNAEIDFGSIE